MNPAPWKEMVDRIIGSLLNHDLVLYVGIQYNKKGAG